MCNKRVQILFECFEIQINSVKNTNSFYNAKKRNFLKKIILKEGLLI